MARHSRQRAAPDEGRGGGAAETKMIRQTMDGADFSGDAYMAREKSRLAREFWPKFKRFGARLPFAEDLVAAYFCAFDRNTPRHVQAALVGALAYFVLPFDVIPDMLPLVGFTDDAAVLATAIRMVASHIRPEHRQAARRVLARAAGEPEGAGPEGGGRAPDDGGQTAEEGPASRCL